MNIIGFFRKTTITYVDKVHEAGDVYTYRFTTNKPLKHRAGEHGVFILPGFKGVHIFSLASAPEEDFVMIGTHARAGSSYKQRLESLQPGETMTMLGPVLDFTFQEGVNDYVFLAQGIGITPFRSMLVHAGKARLDATTTLIHVDSYEHVYKSLTETLSTNAHYPINPEQFTEHVTTVVSQHANALYYLSGSPKFVSATIKTLEERGISRSAIKTDTFLGY